MAPVVATVRENEGAGLYRGAPGFGRCGLKRQPLPIISNYAAVVQRYTMPLLTTGSYVLSSMFYLNRCASGNWYCTAATVTNHLKLCCCSATLHHAAADDRRLRAQQHVLFEPLCQRQLVLYSSSTRKLKVEYLPPNASRAAGWLCRFFFLFRYGKAPAG